jgi:hypothetical protein
LLGEIENSGELPNPQFLGLVELLSHEQSFQAAKTLAGDHLPTLLPFIEEIKAHKFHPPEHDIEIVSDDEEESEETFEYAWIGWRRWLLNVIQ